MNLIDRHARRYTRAVTRSNGRGPKPNNLSLFKYRPVPLAGLDGRPAGAVCVMRANVSRALSVTAKHREPIWNRTMAMV